MPRFSDCAPCERERHDRCTGEGMTGGACECWKYDHYGALDPDPDEFADWDTDNAQADARQRRYERLYGW